MMSIKELNYDQVLDLEDRKYKQFLHYYNNTCFSIDEIFSIIGFTNLRNSSVRNIRKRLRDDGYDSMKRAGSIRRGDWL